MASDNEWKEWRDEEEEEGTACKCFYQFSSKNPFCEIWKETKERLWIRKWKQKKLFFENEWNFLFVCYHADSRRVGR